MTGIQSCLNVSRISKLLLRGVFFYATFFGVISFRIERKGSRLVAINSRGYLWICLVIRLLTCGFFGYSYDIWGSQYADFYIRAFFSLRLYGCLICSAIIMVLQFWFGEELLILINRFLELFRRMRNLTQCHKNGFGDKNEFALITVKVISLIFVFISFRFTHSPWVLFTVLCDLYTSIGTGMIMHLCFVGYLSIGVLYKDLNSYVLCQLKPQLSSLNEDDIGLNQQPTREAISNLNKCLRLYEEIHQVSRRFQRLFNLPLFLILAQFLFAMAMVSYHAILQMNYAFNLWGLVIKLLIDVVLLTMSVHSAVSASRLVKRLSLENFYVTENKGHHQKLELFLGRLHHQELQVCPLGLFEVSNELTLFFLSAMVTYVTFLVQYDMQSQQM
ncbi:putative gustatory receptor 93b [Drosophila suzukii]|uniref:Gustatory receptor n=1 Tax=Drosophila suzukii TaxID=28584 RepID=A0AB40A7N7_DROSZ